MLFFSALILSLLCTVPAHALSLIWEYGGTGTVDVQRSANPAGPWATVATILATQQSYPLPPTADRQWYSVNSPVGRSNVVQHAPILTDIVSSTVEALSARLENLTARLTALESPSPISNLTIRMIDADRVEIVGTNCLRLETDGSGLRRVVRCVH